VVPNTKSVDPKNQHMGMALLHEEEEDHSRSDEKKEHGAKDRYSSEPQKAHPTKFGGCVLRCLASRLANVIR